MKLSKQSIQKARTIASINSVRLGKAIALVIRRQNRMNDRPTMVGSVKKAEGYYIL
jgi:hypothetical protein